MLKRTCVTGGLIVAAAAGTLLTGSAASAQSMGDWDHFRHHARSQNRNVNANRNIAKNRIKIRLKNRNNNVAVARNRQRQHQRQFQLERRPRHHRWTQGFGPADG